jgi:uncharacterized protein YndB with AHSA1/START domain
MIAVDNGRMRPTVEVSTLVAASPAAVYDLISDVTRMGEWSPETVGCRWTSGTGPAVGARFVGVNAHGSSRWRTQCRVVAAERGREFAFEVVGANVLKVSTWRYEFAPTAEGCRVTEHWTDRRGALLRWYGRHRQGIADRVEHNRRGMERTLERLKAVAEAVGRPAQPHA